MLLHLSSILLLVDEGGVCSRFVYPEDALSLGSDGGTTYLLEDDISDAVPQNIENTGLSRNTGFISFTHQGNDVPAIVSKLAFVHEIGHSLGSPVKILLKR